MTMDFVRLSDYELDEPLTAETVAEITGAPIVNHPARSSRNS